MKRITKIISNGPDATTMAAREFAATLTGGEVIGLIGNLGAGKTSFVQELGKAIGVQERITSPTFVYMHTHPLKGEKFRLFVHADAYRVGPDDLRSIGIEEFFGNAGTVVVIEWADRVKTIMPKGAIIINFKHLGGDKREIRIAR